MHNGEFFESSKEIVKNFLSSVIAIDDRLFFTSSRDTPTAVGIQDDFDSVGEESSGLGVFSGDAPQAEAIALLNRDNSHQLNYQSLSLAFSEHGINCCGFIPDVEIFPTIDIASTRIMESSRRADITILDWSMDSGFGHEAGTLAKASIGKILKNDQEQHGRLRLIVIYTAESDVNNISRQLMNYLISIQDGDIKPKLKQGSISFKNSNLEFCKITIIKKEESVDQLKNKTIDLFTNLTIGLLSNATLSAIGELRDRTHHILHAFNKHLDPAYLSHVLGLLSSYEVREKAHEVAFDYATELISEEFKSNLQISHNLKKNLDLEKLKQWSDYVASTQLNNLIGLKVDTANVSVTSDRLKRLLDISTEAELEAVLQEEPRIATTTKKFKKIQINLNGINHYPHESLSAIECKRRDVRSLKNNTHFPTIKQGTIVQRKSSYYICMQPLCDTVRIREDRKFIFLEIERINNNGKFTHVIRDDKSGFIKFNIVPGSKKLHLFKFSPDPHSNAIKVLLHNGKYKVKYKIGSNRGAYLIWHGELKTNIAQAIANKLAEHISRVGLDTNEWLRTQ